MASIPLRSFIKGVCWETIGFIITLFAVYGFYGNFMIANFLSSLGFTAILTAIKILLFFVHERIWKKIRWGKYHIVGGKMIFDKERKKKK